MMLWLDMPIATKYIAKGDKGGAVAISHYFVKGSIPKSKCTITCKAERFSYKGE